MYYVLRFWLLIFVVNLTQNNILIKCEPDWTVDLLSVETESNTPDKMYIEVNITRPVRGIFAVSGIVEVKVDIPDECLVIATTEYSPTGAMFFQTPFNVSPIKYSAFMNSFYKEIFLETLLDCADNVERVDDKFVPPFKKRVMHLNNCMVSNKNMPSKLKNGIYKVRVAFTNFIDTCVTFVAEVYQEQ